MSGVSNAAATVKEALTFLLELLPYSKLFRAPATRQACTTYRQIAAMQ
jgi:hypothetical protein